MRVLVYEDPEEHGALLADTVVERLAKSGMEAEVLKNAEEVEKHNSPEDVDFIVIHTERGQGASLNLKEKFSNAKLVAYSAIVSSQEQYIEDENTTGAEFREDLLEIHSDAINRIHDGQLERALGLPMLDMFGLPRED
jgi:hypothetical protein